MIYLGSHNQVRPQKKGIRWPEFNKSRQIKPVVIVQWRPISARKLITVSDKNKLI